jgi:long-chain acyl-CoA synthetase
MTLREPSPQRGVVPLHCSLFPLSGHWNVPERPWHRHYPPEVPFALLCPDIRLEELARLASEHFPTRKAVIFQQTAWDYGELWERIKHVAGQLRALKFEPGDRVVLALPNCPEFVVFWFACQWIGVQIVHGSPLYSGVELARLVRQTRAKALVGLDLRIRPCLEATHQTQVPYLFVVTLLPHLSYALGAAYRFRRWMENGGQAASGTTVVDFDEFYQPGPYPPERPLLSDPDLPAVLQPTGGTTGTPKLAVLSHRNLLSNVAQLHAISGKEPGQEVVLCILPFFHVFGATVAMLCSVGGAATMALQAKFNARRALKLCQSYRVTVAPMVPFMMRALCQELRRRSYDLSALRVCLSGASPLSEEVRREFVALTGAEVCEGYGLSEASPVTHANFPGRVKPGTVGMPLPDTDARIVDVETGLRDLKPGEVGELIVRGPQVMQGYFEAPEETARVLRDGWLYTGDLAVADEDGYFRIVDRKKDMIISGGLKVYPSEVEDILRTYPGVRECAVVGEPDQMWGERVVAWVVTESGQPLNAEALKDYARQHLARYRVPREIYFVEKLPLNFLGKVRRAALREQVAASQRATTTAPEEHR